MMAAGAGAGGPLGTAAHGPDQLQMDQKHEHVRRWLERVFAGEEVPEYEINSHTVDFLYEMAVENEVREREVEVIIADLDQKTREYASEIARMQSVMESLGLKMSDLSPEAQRHVKALAGVALALGAKDTSETSLLLALTELSQRQAARQVKEVELEQELERLQESARKAVARETKHKELLAELSEQAKSLVPSLDKQKRDNEFLQQKAHQYHKLVTGMKEELRESGYDPSLSHTALQQRVPEIEDLQQQVAVLKSQLDSYQDLPPDLELAKVKVEEAKRELARLESEIARTIDLVHAEK